MLYYHQTTSQLPGVLDDFDPDYQAPIPFGRLVELSQDPRKLQFLRPRQALKNICFPSLTLRSILEGQGDADAYKELLRNQENFPFSSWRGDEMQRQLWRLWVIEVGLALQSSFSSLPSGSCCPHQTLAWITKTSSRYRHVTPPGV